MVKWIIHVTRRVDNKPVTEQLFASRRKSTMPESEITRITRSTARGFLSRNPQPKYKYIEDPADVVSLTYKNQFSQFNVKYYELKVTVSPIFGRFSGERVVFHYDWDTVKMSVDKTLVYVMFLRAGTSPENVLRFCLNFLYSSDAKRILRWGDNYFVFCLSVIYFMYLSTQNVVMIKRKWRIFWPSNPLNPKKYFTLHRDVWFSIKEARALTRTANWCLTLHD